MGYSKKKKKKHQLEASKDSENKKWVIAGISIKIPLKPVSAAKAVEDFREDDGGACPTTPTARESKIPEILRCPPAPRKRKPASSPSCHFNGVVEFFNPPDLESVFIYCAEADTAKPNNGTCCD